MPFDLYLNSLSTTVPIIFDFYKKAKWSESEY